MGDTITAGFLDTFGDTGTVTPNVPIWQSFLGDGRTKLYPYAKANDGTLIPLFLQSVGLDVSTKLSAVLDNIGGVTLQWTLVPGATGYLVARDGGDGESVTTGGTATSYQFLNLVDGQDYTLSVRPIPTGRLVTMVVTAININTPVIVPLGFGAGNFGTTPFGA